VDEEFWRRWKAGASPFDGVTLWAGKPMPLSILHQALAPTAESLRQEWAREPLFTIREEYDSEGVGFIPEATAWDDLRQLVSSADALRSAANHDDCVIPSFFPESREFLLRLFVPSVTSQPKRQEWKGGFDLTCSKAMADRIEVTLRSISTLDLVREPAGPYHKRWWGC
jgi:hypothetical protein